MSTINLETIGAQNITRRLVANGIDTISFTVPGSTALTDPDVASQGSFVTATYKDISLFGRVARVHKSGEGDSESQSVEIHGLWASLQKVTYLQSWTIWNASSEESVQATRPRVILGMDASGARVTTGAQIADAIQWAASRGLPISVGTVDAGIAMPFDEQENISVADVILSILRLRPDYVAWFEGQLFHCRLRSNLASVSLPLSACRGLRHSARYDLLVPGVIVHYEKTHNDDGRARTSVEIDTAGDASNWAAVRLLYDLQGRSRSFLTAEIETQDLPENLTLDKAFLKQMHPWLQAVDDADITITAAARGSAEPLPRMLLKGPVPDWLDKDTEEEQLTWVIDYTVKVGDPAIVVETISGLTLTASIVATEAVTRKYQRLASLDTGEVTPTGVAAALYSAWGTLWHEGSVTLEDVECPGTYRPGQNLTVNSISSPIQQVVENCETGTTTLTIGPPANINADTLLSMFRGLRARRYAYSRGDRISGEPEGEDGGALQTGRAPDTRPTSGAGQTKRLRLLHTGDPTHEIDLNPADTQFEGTPAPTAIKTREIIIVQSDGSDGYELRKAQVLCSAPYGDPIPLRLLPQGGNDGDILAIVNGSPAWEETPECDEESSS